MAFDSHLIREAVINFTAEKKIIQETVICFKGSPVANWDFLQHLDLSQNWQCLFNNNPFVVTSKEHALLLDLSKLKKSFGN